MRILERTPLHATVQADEGETRHDYVMTFHFTLVSGQWKLIHYEASTHEAISRDMFVRLADATRQYLTNVVKGLHT